MSVIVECAVRPAAPEAPAGDSPGGNPAVIAALLDGLAASPQDSLAEEIEGIARAMNDLRARIDALAEETRSILLLIARLGSERPESDGLPRLMASPALRRGSPHVSKREREILSRMLGGKNNREISRELAISEKTVKNHLWKLYRKLGVKNRTQLFHRLIST